MSPKQFQETVEENFHNLDPNELENIVNSMEGLTKPEIQKALEFSLLAIVITCIECDINLSDLMNKVTKRIQKNVKFWS